MEKTVLTVEGMSCDHCKNAVTKAVSAIKGVFSVAVDLGAKTVEVEYDPSVAALGAIKAGIEEEGYDVISS
ncbi:MAG: cation transporter [Oscillospiraceae bacterium]|nr:cation transporter [Oscillospiraceae bacterium]